jgi:hypothetical protein
VIGTQHVGPDERAFEARAPGGAVEEIIKSASRRFDQCLALHSELRVTIIRVDGELRQRW